MLIQSRRSLMPTIVILLTPKVPEGFFGDLMTKKR